MLKLSLLAATVAFTLGCQQEAQQEKQVQLNTEDEKAAYAIGAQFATLLSESLDKQSEIGITLDKNILLKGIEESLHGKSQLTPEEMQTTLVALDQRVNEKIQTAMQEKRAANSAAGETFRNEFAQQDGVVKTESGLLYQVLTPAQGDSPVETDTVKVHYVGTLTDGTQFDSSVERGEPVTFPLSMVIPGWKEGVQLMQVGSKYKFVIPPELAYGEMDRPSIPGQSTLVFEVELLEIVTEEVEESQ